PRGASRPAWESRRRPDRAGPDLARFVRHSIRKINQALGVAWHIAGRIALGLARDLIVRRAGRNGKARDQLRADLMGASVGLQARNLRRQQSRGDDHQSGEWERAAGGAAAKIDLSAILLPHHSIALQVRRPAAPGRGPQGSATLIHLAIISVTISIAYGTYLATKMMSSGRQLRWLMSRHSAGAYQALHRGPRRVISVLRQAEAPRHRRRPTAFYREDCLPCPPS